MTRCNSTMLAICAGATLLPSLLVCTYTTAEDIAKPPSVSLSDPRIIADGRSIFAKSCAVGYCHGSEGRAGRGPRLRGRNLERDYLFRVTLEGIPRSSMPAWKNKLSEEEIWSVVAYILTLSDEESPAGQQTVPAVTNLREKESQARQIAQSDTSPRLDQGMLAGDPERGKRLFFDPSSDLNCGMCHRFQGIGTEVGPDLSHMNEKAAREILRDIVWPNATVSPGWQLFTVTTKEGEQIRGVKVEETNTHIRMYDTSALPPVLRTIEKAQIQNHLMENRSAMPNSYSDLYTLKELLDLIAFLKSADATPVSLQDLF